MKSNVIIASSEPWIWSCCCVVVATSIARKRIARLNAGRRQRLLEEMAVMRELPERRLESAKRMRVKVSTGSLIYVDRNVYSVPSRLIGEVIEARVTMDTVEVWYGQRKVVVMPRLRGQRKHRVDYRLLQSICKQRNVFA